MAKEHVNVLVTGSTGFIGVAVCRTLLELGYGVNALYRNEEKAEIFGGSPVRLVRGDLLKRTTLDRAVEGSEAVIHCAAFTGVWARDETLVQRLNVDATENLLLSAERAGVKRFVFASTAGVFGPSLEGIVTEHTRRTIDFFNIYERTKAAAESSVIGASSPRMETVVVNPTRVYGPGVLSESNGITRMAERYVRGTWKFLPGDGEAVGNYGFIDDVAKGHVLALERGAGGERYILGGENVTYNELFSRLGSITRNTRRLMPIPVPLMLAAAKLMTAMAQITKSEPMITPDLVRKFSYQWEVSSEKSRTELGYEITPLNKGLAVTVEWLLRANRRIF